MSVWRHTRGQKRKRNKEERKNPFRQKYNTTEQTLSKKHSFKLQTQQQMLLMVDLQKNLTAYPSTDRVLRETNTMQQNHYVKN